MWKHYKLIASFIILALATSVFIHSQGRTTNDGLNPQLPAALGANGGLKVEGIAAGVAAPTNITQVGGVNISTGVGPAGTGIPRVTTSRDDISGSVSFTSNTACPAASATAVTTSSGCIQVPVTGYSGAGIDIQAGTLVGTVLYEYSADGGTSWSAAIAIVGGAQVFTTVFPSSNALTSVNFVIGSGWSHVRVRCSAFTSGAATVVGRASSLSSSLALGVLPVGFIGGAAPLFGSSVALKTQTGVPAVATNLLNVQQSGDPYGIPFVRQDHLNRINCVLTTTNTTSTLITGCSAPGASLSIYITDISVYGGVAVGATAAAIIQSGTGGNCGTATAINYYCQHVATAGCEAEFTIPKKMVANNEVCLLDASVGTKFVTVGGFIAP